MRWRRRRHSTMKHAPSMPRPSSHGGRDWWRSGKTSAATTRSTSSLARRRVLTVDGFVIFTSRVSVEMIQKAAAIGVPLVVAVSAPTALAVRMAEVAGITLVAVARHDGFEIYANAHRLVQSASTEKSEF